MLSFDFAQYLTLFIFAAIVLFAVCFFVKLFSVTARRKGGAVHAIPIMFVTVMLISALVLLVIVNYKEVSGFLKENLSVAAIMYLRELAELVAVGRIAPGSNMLYLLNLTLYAWSSFIFLFCAFSAVILVHCVKYLVCFLLPHETKIAAYKKLIKIKTNSVYTFDIILCYGKQRQ